MVLERNFFAETEIGTEPFMDEIPLAVVRSIVVIAVSLIQPCSAHSEGDPDRGLMIASRWCNSCHIVQQDDPSLDDGEIGPRFSTLTEYTAQSLKQLLVPGHADMDALSKLSDDEIADIAAHLHRLKAQPRTR